MTTQRVARTARPWAAAFLALALAAGPAPAWAQDRGEPQANPRFQQDSRPIGGGPLEEELPASPTAAPQAQPAEAEAAPATAPVQTFQIGAAQPARQSAAAPVNPMETKVTIRVKGAPLSTFLDTIAAQSKINFLLNEGLESMKVTAYLQNVTVREALQTLLELKSLNYQQIGKTNTYVIKPRSKTVTPMITKIYTLSHIPLITVGGQSQGGAGGGAAVGVNSSGGDSGVEIVNVLKSVLSPPSAGQAAGQIALDRRTNSIVITDVAEVFPQVEQIIAELDKKAPQVMIEAQIVEIDSNRARDLGFQWGGPNGELGSFTMNSRTTAFPLNLPKNLGHTHFFDPIDNSIPAINGAATGLPTVSVTRSLLDLTSLKITLQALVTRAEARFLGKPKVLTINNRSAQIQITQNQAVALQSQQTSVGTVGAQNTVAPQRETTGLTLNVTPQINKEGYITMLVEPKFTDVVDSRLANNVFDTITRQASTLVRVKNGQTLVLGGLLNSVERKQVRKVPFLGYIPLIGWLFTHERVSRVNSDLVIFITPTIVND